MKKWEKKIVVQEEKIKELNRRFDDFFEIIKQVYNIEFKKLEDKVYNELCIKKIITEEQVNEIKDSIKTQNKVNWFIISTVFTLIAYAIEEVLRKGY